MKINLTRIAIILAICLTCVSAAMATPACGQVSATSPAQTAAFSPLYVTATGDPNSPGYVCDIGNLQFSNFDYSVTATPPTVPIPPTAVNAIPQTTTGDQGFDFQGGWSGNQDVSISFTVTALTGFIDDVNIDLIGANTTGTGEINYLEQFCEVSGPKTCSIYTDTPTGPLTTSINLATQSNLGAPQTSLNITKDVFLTTGSNGTAFISKFGNTYTNTVPEPRAVSILLSLGLFAVVVFMKKRSQAVRS